MKTGFKDRTAPKDQKPKDKPVDGKKSPWDFSCPQYDQRSSCFVNAGTNYGTGIKQPVGTDTHSNSYAVPVGRVNTMRLYED
jgi:hypothetical protein